MTLSYRRARFDERRIKHWLLPDLEAQIEAGTIGFLPETTPVAIRPTHVTLMPTVEGQVVEDGEPMEWKTDFVLLNTGFHGDQRLLEMAGVELIGRESSAGL